MFSLGTFLIEPKRQEPTKHQYDWDAATATSSLQKYGLIRDFKLNIEYNHAMLSGHSCFHELETARINGLLGNIDANTGDPQVGWDTDEFLTDIGEATLVMLSVVRNGGLAPGGFNFDAKLLVPFFFFFFFFFLVTIFLYCKINIHPLLVWFLPRATSFLHLEVLDLKYRVILCLAHVGALKNLIIFVLVIEYEVICEPGHSLVVSHCECMHVVPVSSLEGSKWLQVM